MSSKYLVPIESKPVFVFCIEVMTGGAGGLTKLSLRPGLAANAISSSAPVASLPKSSVITAVGANDKANETSSPRPSAISSPEATTI